MHKTVHYKVTTMHTVTPYLQFKGYNPKTLQVLQNEKSYSQLIVNGMVWYTRV